MDSLLQSIKNQWLLECTVLFPSDFSSSKVLRDFVECISKEYQILPIWRARLILIADELNNNSIEHGSLEGDTNEFHIQVAEEGSDLMLHLSVSDTWKGASHKSAKQMEQLREEHRKKDFTKHRSIRWRGLFLIIADLVDMLSFSDTDTGGLVVSIKVRIPTV